MNAKYDIVIIGSGVVGAATALMLSQKASLKIALLDAQTIPESWNPNQHDHRVSAISPASKRIFQNVSVWDRMRVKRISPYLQMKVWEENQRSKIEFDSSEAGISALGYIIEDTVMRTSLYEAIRARDNIDFLYPVKLIDLQKFSDHIEIATDDQKMMTAKLVIAADGANSWVRQQVGIELNTMDYQHVAIVATVKTSLSHQKTAWQSFLKTGPLAFLPLQDAHTSSIVWSTLPEHAKKLLAQDDDTFKKTLSAAFENKLGDVLEVDRRYHFPLQMRHAKNYVQDRIALVGDAAHTLHPLAGQGVNLGLLDAACLAEVIIAAIVKNRNYSSLATLRKYERWRKGDNVAMLKMVEFLKYLFMSEKAIIQSLRSTGLNFTDRASFLKNFFMNRALGKGASLPELAKS